MKNEGKNKLDLLLDLDLDLELFTGKIVILYKGVNTYQRLEHKHELT